MNLYRAVRKGTIFKWMAGREPFHWTRKNRDILELGSKSCRWAVAASRVNSASTVLSFGLGIDVTFELALIERFGCRVLGFDPTPLSMDYIQANVRHERFTAQAVALANYDGTLTFKFPPKSSGERVSLSAFAEYKNCAAEPVNVPCLTLQSLRRQYDLPRVDILKMDIEGAEIAVIEQAVQEDWLADIDQVLVEYHHFLPGLTPAQTRHSIDLMQSAGFAIAWVGRTNHEYLFVRQA